MRFSRGTILSTASHRTCILEVERARRPHPMLLIWYAPATYAARVFAEDWCFSCHAVGNACTSYTSYVYMRRIVPIAGFLARFEQAPSPIPPPPISYRLGWRRLAMTL